MLESSELTRLAYLQAMGVDSYVSRHYLPGAALTRRLAIATQGTTPTGEEAGEPATPRLPDIPLQKAGRAPQERPAAAVADAEPVAEIDTFSIAAVIAGGWLWLEELPQVALAQEQVQLIGAMARALGLPQQQPAVAQFDWPMHTNAQFDLGPDAARSGLLGFIQRQLTDFGISTVVFLGEGCQQRLPEQLAVGQRIRTVSTRAMLGEPLLKRQAWQDLRPHTAPR